MKRRFAGLIGLVTLMAAAPAFGAVTFTTRDTATNQTGNLVSASAEFTIVPDGVLVTINNTTHDIRNYNQSIEGITFTIFGRRAQGTIDYSRARTRTITPDGMQTTPDAQDAGWQLITTGSTYTLRAPGRQVHILPQTEDLSYAKGDKSLKDAPESNPFLVGPVTIHIQNKDIALTDDIIGVKFSWGDELGGFDGKITADTSGGSVNSAGTGGGGGGGDGGGGTPGDISLAPPSSHENFELGLEGTPTGYVGSGQGAGPEAPPGGDAGGDGSGRTNNPAAPQISRADNPFALTVPQGVTGPNPKPPTSVAKDTPVAPPGDTPPDTRVPAGAGGPNPDPTTGTAPDAPASPTPDAPPSIRITLPNNLDGPNPLPPTLTLNPTDPAFSDQTVAPDLALSPDDSTQLGSPFSGSPSTPQSLPEPASLMLLAVGAAPAF